MPLNKWKDITYSWVKRLNIIKMAMLSFAYQPINTICPSTLSLSKSQLLFWSEVDTLIIKFIWKLKGNRIAKKKNKVGELTLYIFKAYLNG